METLRQLESWVASQGCPRAEKREKPGKQGRQGEGAVQWRTACPACEKSWVLSPGEGKRARREGEKAVPGQGRPDEVRVPSGGEEAHQKSLPENEQREGRGNSPCHPWRALGSAAVEESSGWCRRGGELWVKLVF